MGFVKAEVGHALHGIGEAVPVNENAGQFVPARIQNRVGNIAAHIQVIGHFIGIGGRQFIDKGRGSLSIVTSDIRNLVFGEEDGQPLLPLSRVEQLPFPGTHVVVLLYVLDILAGERSGMSVLIKLTIFRNRSETGRIPFDEWNRMVNIMERFRISGQPPSIITLGNLSEYEARDLLGKSLPLPRVPLYYENAILSRAGTNPRALFSLIFLIRTQQLFTQYDIERLPPDCGSSIQSAYIGALLEDGGSGPYFRALLATLCELEGSLPLALNAQLEREYSVQPGTFVKTGVIAESPTAFEIESRQVLAAVRQALDMETVQAARRWILKHLDLARWKEPDRSSRELLLKLRLREYVSDTLLESVLIKLREEKFRGRSEELLLEAYHVRREAEDFLSALDYLLRYLDRLSLRDKLNTAEYQELLSDADRIAAELTARNVALPVKVRIRLCFLHYWQSKSRYDYRAVYGIRTKFSRWRRPALHLKRSVPWRSIGSRPIFSEL